MRQRLLAAVPILLLCCASAIPAADLLLESETALRVREATTGEVVAPLREYLTFTADGIADGKLSVAAGGWAGASLGGAEVAGGNGDLSFAFVEAASASALVRVGRQSVTAGVADEMIDGGYARADLPLGLGLALLAGRPVPPDPDEGVGTAVLGGRFSQSGAGWYEAGLSYVRETDGDRVLRSAGAVDLRLTAAGLVTLAGRSDYDTEAKAWARHSWRLFLDLPAGIRLTGDFSRTDCAVALAPVVFAALRGALVAPGEVVTSAGVGAELPLGAVTIGLRARSNTFDLAEDSSSVEASLGWSSAASGAGFSVIRLQGEDSATFARAWGSTGFGRLTIAADCSVGALDQEVNGTTTSVAASLDGGWRLSPSARLSGGVDFLSGPAEKSELRGALTLHLAFGTRGRG